MEIKTLLEASANWGLGIVLSVAMFLVFKKLLNRVMDSHKEERADFMRLLTEQERADDEHIDKLSDNIERIIDKVSEIDKSVSGQKDSINQGFAHIINILRNEKVDNNGK